MVFRMTYEILPAIRQFVNGRKWPP